MQYANEVRVDGAFEDVVDDVFVALEAEGFGVLADIDVSATFEEKLDREFRQYRILGACSPPLAAEALDAELALGALLPCNVVVYETDGGDVAVLTVDPEVLVGVAENPALDSVAAEVADRFERVRGSLS